MTSQVKFMNFTKTQKSRFLENETFSVQKKKSFITHQGLLYVKNAFVTEVTFKFWHILNIGLIFLFLTLDMYFPVGRSQRESTCSNATLETQE